jgi:hypothetical protein
MDLLKSLKLMNNWFRKIISNEGKLIIFKNSLYNYTSISTILVFCGISNQFLNQVG